MMLFALFALGAHAGAPDDAIRKTLDDFAQGAATRDRARVEAALDPAAVQYIRTPDARFALDTPSYLGMLDAGKVGGTETSVAVHAISVHGSVATATVTREAGPMRFDDAVSLLESDGSWKIVAMAVRAQPKTP